MNVLIIHDQLASLESLRALVESEAENTVAGAVDDSELLHRFAITTKPDVLMLSPAESATLSCVEETAGAMRQQHPDIRIVLLFRKSTESQLAGLVRLGATGYVSEDGSAGCILDALSAVMEGQVYVCPILTPTVLGILCRQAQDYTPPRLTEHQVQIAQLLSSGLSYREIGSQLGRSPATIETHSRRLRRKLQINSLANLRSLKIDETWLQ